jgi:hypothetical protein
VNAPLVILGAVLVALGYVEMALVACEMPKLFEWGWAALVLRGPATTGARLAVGTRGCTKRVVYQVLDEKRLIFVSQDPLYRDSAGPLRGSIALGAGEMLITGRTTLVFFLWKFCFLAGCGWMWWPGSAAQMGSLAAFALELALVALGLFAVVAPIELAQARREFLTDVAEVEAALGIAPPA